jgi:eukaryotic-like serine/threonine-protein kinase
VREGDLVAGRYRLLRPIGAGGMGAVWAARHELLGREVALKIAVAGERAGLQAHEARDLFLREVRIIGKLRHPNVVDIDDAGEAGDQLYLAMELLEGESLAQRIARGPFTPAEALAVAAEVCRGLAAAHAAGVVHRDLKPENVFLAHGPSGGVVPKLLDFGVSSARGVTTLHRGRQFGTPAYLSPEQALGESTVDHRSDVWALGIVLYEMLTGHLPFAAASYPALLPLIIEAPTPPLPPSIPAEVRTVVAGCLAKDRGDRYPTADALLEAIDRAHAALPAGEPGSTRSGFFVETGRGVTASVLAPDLVRGGSGRTARFGLALAILAVPIAIGIAAMARGVRAPAAGSSTLASEPPPPPSGAAPQRPASAEPVVAAAAPPPSSSEASSAASPYPDASARPARRPGSRRGLGAPAARPPQSRVTRIDNAGF